jgi:predicted metal-dependent phosphoesterase TrpH
MPAHGRVDLHLHTTASDGTLAADAVVELAARAGIETLSITDHDSVAALPLATATAARLGVRCLPGVEISASVDGLSVHILGYCMDPATPGFGERLEWYRSARLARARAIVERLAELGIEISFERVCAIAGDGAVGRPHIAEALLEAGQVTLFQEAFDRYIGVHAPAYVPRPRIDPADAITLVRHAGGLAGLAHPGTLHHDAWIPPMVEAGLEAIEVWHPRHDAARVRRYATMARELGLIATGGSDFHGGHRGDSQIGEQPVPASVVEELEARAALRE